MVRAPKISDANAPIDRTVYNALIDDYVSKTEDCPVAVTGTHPHANNTDEQTIFEITPSVITQISNLYFDWANLTQDTTLKLYSKVDGTNYKELIDLRLLVNASRRGNASVMKDLMFNTAFKVTLTSSIAEGSSKNVPWRYFKEEY